MCGPMVMGRLPVREACWAIRTVGSIIREEGLGRMDWRFWIAEEVRRSEAGREE